MKGTSPFQAPQTRENTHTHMLRVIIQQRCAGGSEEDTEDLKA